MVIKFTVYGNPQPKQRPRVVKGRAYTPKETVQAEKTIREVYQSIYGDFEFPPKVPLHLIVLEFYPVPKSDSKKLRAAKLSGEIRPMQKPDVDNVAKLVLDAGNGVIYPDDTQIVKLMCEKWYSEEPRVEIMIVDIKKECWLCGATGNVEPLERHHVFNGNPGRKLSEKYGAVVWLCGNTCHRLGKYAVHQNGETARRLKAWQQQKMMDDFGWSVEDFRNIFGKSYI